MSFLSIIPHPTITTCQKSHYPPTGYSGYVDELSNQLNTAVISYASVCILQAGAFRILQKIFQNFALFWQSKKSPVLSREKGRYYRLSAERR